MNSKDTIIAQATPPGRGGVGIIRVSGPLAAQIGTLVTGTKLKPRYAHYLPFKDDNNIILDQGIAIFFPNPNSFTGEDVLELQGHGGPVIIDMLIQRILKIKGVRSAKPGEFSEQAFLNNKLDLTQAEAIADLIDASSQQAARSAVNSLQGVFSNKINKIVNDVINLRIYVEAAIDFPEEEIDFLNDGIITNSLLKIISDVENIKKEAFQGSIMREGMKVVIAGRPNAGKSSLLNALSGRNSAIVTHVAGTTRDVLKEHINIDGMPLHIIDTAGLRDTNDEVEKIGIEKAWQEINQADRILFMVDGTTTTATDPKTIWPDFIDKLPQNIGITMIRNKIDITNEKLGLNSLQNSMPIIHLSAKSGNGIDILKDHLKECMGFTSNLEGGFMARRRHLDAIDKCYEHLLIGQDQLNNFMAGEILAEELRISQEYLNEITGEFGSDDLLSKIFSSFCIGK